MQRYALQFSVVLVCGLGCTKSSTEHPPQPKFTRAALPAPGDPTPCNAAPSPTVCEWANSIDAIVVGTLTQVRPLDSPVWVSDGESSHLADTCDGDFVNIGVHLQIEVTSTLYGAPPDVVDVSVGSMVAGGWSSPPFVENGEVRWVNQQTPILEAGTTIGVAITKVPNTSAWALMGEFPFTFEADGSLVMEEECEWPAPDPRPADYWALETALEQCAVATNSTRAARVAHFTQRPDYSHAASCHYLDERRSTPVDAGGSPDADM